LTSGKIHVFAFPLTFLRKTITGPIEKDFFDFFRRNAVLGRQFFNNRFQPDEVVNVHTVTPVWLKVI
jgi:hypothetical protein